MTELDPPLPPPASPPPLPLVDFAAHGRGSAGVELSDVSQTTCRPLYQQGLVAQGPLHRIDEPDSAFDLVFSSEVLEHVPPNLANASVRELVRIAKRDVFTTISLRPSALDRPGRPPKVHLTVRPREWWERLFEEAGCVRNEEAYRKFQQFGALPPIPSFPSQAT